MNSIQNQSFSSRFDREIGTTVQGAAFVECKFYNSAFSLCNESGNRSVARDLRFQRCRVCHCDVGPAILEDIEVIDLFTDGLFILWGPLFRRVSLRGSLGTIKINTTVSIVDRDSAVQARFDKSRKQFYEQGDWALDISEARFREFNMRGVPAHLVRIDPATQAVVTRERALREGWREKVRARNDFWIFAIDLFLESDDQDTVLVAPKAGPRKEFRELVDSMKELRDLGVAF